MAKFVAENQQVREVLQANMQLLKDSLERQGLVVQGFSVSVQQDSQRGYNGNENQQPNKRTNGNLNTGRIPFGNINTVENLADSQSMNPYTMNDSRINLTA